MATKYLDSTGLIYLWGKIKSLVNNAISALSSVYQPKEEGKGLSTNDFTTAEKEKLAGIAEGAGVNVQSDWSESSSSSAAFIKNKPTNLSDFSDDATHRLVTDEEKAAWNNKHDIKEYSIGADLPVLGDYNATTHTYAITTTNINSTVQSMLKQMYDSLGDNRIGVFKIRFGNNDPVDGLMYLGGSSTYFLTFEHEGVIYKYNITNPAGGSPICNVAAYSPTHLVAKAEYDAALTSLTTDLNSKAANTTTVNGHPLSENVTVTKGDVGLGNVTNDAQVKRAEMGLANGVATLDASGRIPSSQLPSYVDDVVESYPVAGATALTAGWLSVESGGSALTPEGGKIYVLMTDSGDYTANSQFRWGGTAYVKLNDGGVSSITTSEIDSITNQ